MVKCNILFFINAIIIYENILIMNSCPLCLDTIGDAKTVLKCGHEFCSDCILNSLAKNTGTTEGTTRNLCPMCRTPMCDKIEPDTSLSYTLQNLRRTIYDYDIEVEELNETLNRANITINQHLNIIRYQRKYIKNLMEKNSKYDENNNLKNKFVIIIQSIWRGRKGREKAKYYHDKKYKILKEISSKTIQRICRGFFVRKWMNIYNQLNKNLDTDTSSWRDYQQLTYNQNVWKLLCESASLTIQKEYVLGNNTIIYLTNIPVSPWKNQLIQRVHKRTVWKLFINSTIRKIQKWWLYCLNNYKFGIEYSDMDTSLDWWMT